MDTKKNVLLVGLLLCLLLGVVGTDRLDHRVRTVCTTMPPLMPAFTFMKGMTLSAIWLCTYGLWYLTVRWCWKRNVESRPPAR